MTQEVKLVKEVYGRNTFTRVVDTSFTELYTPVTASVVPAQQITVDEFFDLYNELFFEIPATGELNSHEYLVARSTEYLGGGVLTDNEKAYIEEINSLRQQLLEANANFLSLSNTV
jgi:hypothetical protein